MGKPREQRLGEVFVSLADTLVADYDVIDLLYNLSTACVELLAVDTAGILVTADGKGSLQTVASSHERTELLELFQLQNDEGPCLDTFRQGQPVTLRRSRPRGRAVAEVQRPRPRLPVGTHATNACPGHGDRRAQPLRSSGGSGARHRPV